MFFCNRKERDDCKILFCNIQLGGTDPLYVRFQARGAPVVGTTLDYFDFRGLRVVQDRQMALLGECVIGAEVAQRLGLQPAVIPRDPARPGGCLSSEDEDEDEDGRCAGAQLPAG